MSVLGQSKDKGAAAVLPGATPVDRTGFFQNVGAGFHEAIAGPHSTRVGEAIYQQRYYDQIIGALNTEGEQGDDYVPSLVRKDSPLYRPVQGERVNQNGIVYLPVKRKFRNPFVSSPSLTKTSNPIMSLYGGGDKEEVSQIWSAIQRVRQRKPEFLKAFPNEGAIAALALKERQKQVAEAQRITSRSSTAGTVGSFIGGMGGSLLSMDPENAVGGLGGAAGKTVARTILKRAGEGAVANALAATAAVPGQITDSERLGSEMTTGDVVKGIAQTAAIGAVIGGAHASAPHVLGAAKGGVEKVAGAVAENLPAPARNAVVAASMRAGTVKDRQLLTEFRRLHSPYAAIGDTSTPDEKAAMHVVERDAEVREASPFHPEADTSHHDRLQAIANDLGIGLAPELPSPAPVQTPTVRDQSSTGGTRRAASYEDALGRAEGSTRNPESTADGHFQFTQGTWLEYAPRVTSTAGMSRAQILALRHDLPIAQKAERLFRADNGRYLRDHGLEDSPGNLSLAHFLGKHDAANVLKADPSAPIERLIDPRSLAANRKVLEGKSASQVVAWAHKRIGATTDGPVARADAVPDYPYEDVPPYETATLTPDEVTTNAELMQYKSGGDTEGVTGKLKDVTAWNPILSSEIMVWQPKEGGHIVVDGHQRTGLAKRLYADDPSVRLPAIVLREVDGISAEQARVIGALRNINLGTGSLEDNARVLRDAPEAAEMLRGAENRRDIEGLAKLSYEGFGAVLNNIIDPRVAAQIGHLSPPERHMAMVGLLQGVSSPGEAGNVIRQAMADGFGDEHQLNLLGEQPQHSLYVPIARILSAASKKLREEKRTFRVLAEKAGRIEEAGNVLDRTANQDRVVGADEAIAILERTAHSTGPVRSALIQAARAELSGARRADAVNRFLDDLSGIDLRAAAAGHETSSPAREPSGAEGGGDAAEAPDGELPLSLFDRAVAAKDRAEPFSDPVAASKEQTPLLEHDLRMDAEDAPPPLFDTPETGYRVSEEGDRPQTLQDIMDEAENDERAAEAMRACLQPPKVTE